jgi:hypothetical protein
MSTKYIPQINETNFVFPNYELSEYDVDIIHNINDLSVSGTVTNFVVSGTARTTGITFTHDWTWSKNSAEPFISNSGQIHLLSVHMIAGGQTYYKPWRCVDIVTSGTTGSSTYSGSNTVTVTPSMVGLTTFSSGTYYFEIRMIGLKSIYPICQTLSITVT